MQKFLKIIAVTGLAYVMFVALMELTFGFLQPDMEGGVVLITRNAEGAPRERTLAGFPFNEALYVASNHWLRGWYNQALENPQVDVVREGVRSAYTAVPVVGAERDALAAAYTMGFVLRFICGFAPSKFIRLDAA